jgi:hypothetical protein
LTVTFSGRRGWSQTKSSLTTKFDGRVTIPLADVLERVIQLQAQVEELTRIVTVQVDVTNQTTELLGRLLATSSNRLDAIEDSLGGILPAGTSSSESGTERTSRAKTAAKTAVKPSSSADDKQ